MKIDYLTVKLRFQTSKVREIELPDIKQQEAILKHINAAMEEWNAHIVDIEVKASTGEEND
jgi:hypothetical protein